MATYREHIDMDLSHKNEDLEAGMLRLYLDENFVENDEGVLTLNTNPNQTNSGNVLFSGIEYHIGRRHFGINQGKFDELQRINDPNGNNILKTLARTLTPKNTAKTLADAIEDEGGYFDIKKAKQLIAKAEQDYSETTLVAQLKEDLGKKPEDWVAAIRELNYEYNFIKTDEKFRKLTENKGVEELLQTYAGFVLRARAQDRDWKQG
jgi:hypothetical protein